MDKRFWLAGIVASVLIILLGFVFHGVIMSGDYERIRNLFRPEAEAMANLPINILAHVIMGFAFAWIYKQGITDAPWLGQGIRFGIAVALLVTVPWYLIYYSIQPFPAQTVGKQLILDSISLFLIAIAVAFIYKKPAAAETARPEAAE
jgi:hypothetical protein